MRYTRSINDLARITPPLHNDANSTVAANIKAELGYAGIKQTDLATGLGQNDMWLSRRLSSNPPFSVIEVQAISEYFNMEPGDFFTKRTRPKRPDGANLPPKDYSAVSSGNVTHIDFAHKSQKAG